MSGAGLEGAEGVTGEDGAVASHDQGELGRVDGVGGSSESVGVGGASEGGEVQGAGGEDGHGAGVGTPASPVGSASERAPTGGDGDGSDEATADAGEDEEERMWLVLDDSIWGRIFGMVADATTLRRLPFVCKKFNNVYRANTNAIWRTLVEKQRWRQAKLRARNMQDFYEFKSRETTRNWRSGTCTFTCLWGHEDAVCCLNFDERLLVSGSMDSTIKLWDLHGTRECLATLEGHQGTVYQVRLQRDTIVSCSGDRSVRIWDIESGACTLNEILRSDTSCALYDLKTDGWNEIVVACHDGSLRFLDVRVPGLETQRVSHHNGNVLCVEWDRNNHVVTGSTDKTAKVFDRRMNAAMSMYKHKKAVTCVAWDYPSRTIVTGSLDKTVRSWAWETGKAVKKYLGHSESISAVQVRGKRMVTGSNDRTIRLWSLGSKWAQVFGGYSGNVYALQFNENLLVNGSVRTINVWDFEHIA